MGGGGGEGSADLPREMSLTRKIINKNLAVLTTMVIMPSVRRTARPTRSRKWMRRRLLRRKKGKMNTTRAGDLDRLASPALSLSLLLHASSCAYFLPPSHPRTSQDNLHNSSPTILSPQVTF